MHNFRQASCDLAPGEYSALREHDHCFARAARLSTIAIVQKYRRPCVRGIPDRCSAVSGLLRSQPWITGSVSEPASAFEYMTLLFENHSASSHLTAPDRWRQPYI